MIGQLTEGRGGVMHEGSVGERKQKGETLSTYFATWVATQRGTFGWKRGGGVTQAPPFFARRAKPRSPDLPDTIFAPTVIRLLLVTNLSLVID